MKEAVVIEEYTPGRMTVNGEKYERDLKIIGDRIVTAWWREKDHQLDVGDVEDILHAAPEVLVIGMGYAGNMHVEETLRSRFREEGIEVIAEGTDHAIKTFNDLRSKEKDVAGAFHLTC
jgi:hypothetical protein